MANPSLVLELKIMLGPHLPFFSPRKMHAAHESARKPYPANTCLVLFVQAIASCSCWSGILCCLGIVPSCAQFQVTQLTAALNPACNVAISHTHTPKEGSRISLFYRAREDATELCRTEDASTTFRNVSKQQHHPASSIQHPLRLASFIFYLRRVTAGKTR
jgi:hypothetical protein